MTKRYKTEFPLIILINLHRKMHLYMSNNWLKDYGIFNLSAGAYPEQVEDSFTAYFMDEQSRLDFQMRYL
jgi:hypothetical protein